MSAKLRHEFTATGESEPIYLSGSFTITIRDGDGTVKPTRKPTEQDGFGDVAINGDGTPASYVVSGGSITVEGHEPGVNMPWRLECTTYNSGTIVGIIQPAEEIS